MAKIPEYYDMGDPSNITMDRLLFLIEEMYKDLAVAINMKPDLYQRTTDGLVSDVDMSVGTLNINTNTLKIEMLTNQPTTTTVIWSQIS